MTLYGKIIVFKSLAFSKLIYVAAMSSVSSDIIKLLESIHKNFVWDNKRPNIKHTTLVNDYSLGGLKDIDIPSKFKSLRLNWLVRLFDKNFHPWKQIPLYYIMRVSRNFNLFHPNLCIPNSMLNNIPMFYKNIINFWQDISYAPPTCVSTILSESLCFNSLIKIDNSPILPSFFDSVDQIYISHLFNENGMLISWAEASVRLKMRNFFKWIQIVNAIPAHWKTIVMNSTLDRSSCCLGQHLNYLGKIFPVDRLNSRFFYDMFIAKISTAPTSQKYFERHFGHEFKWADIYRLPHLITVDTYTRFFQ